jgi:hypothetical protein
VGALLVPLAAAVPAAVALVITIAGRAAAYPPGPKERRNRAPGPPAEAVPQPEPADVS